MGDGMDAAERVAGELISDEVLPPGAYWHQRLDKGTMLRIVDLQGCQAVDTLIYDAADTQVRYNAANTMKLAHSIYLSKGCVIYDDLAQPLMTIVEDTVGRHDTLADGISKAGDHVDLRCEKDVIVVISNCPQEFNPCSGGNPTPIRVTVWRPN